MRQLSRYLPLSCAELEQLGISGHAMVVGGGVCCGPGHPEDPSGLLWEETPSLMLCYPCSLHTHLHTLLTPTQPHSTAPKRQLPLLGAP